MDIAQADKFLEDASQLNPGPWVSHSRNAGKAAKLITERVPAYDPDFAYVCGLLHDIGRRNGPSQLRHCLDGYSFLKDSYPEVARICITHSFPVKDIRFYHGEFDIPKHGLDWLKDFLNNSEYNYYDRLIQLVDCIAVEEGFTKMELRLFDVALRYGTHDFTHERWTQQLQLKDQFKRDYSVDIDELFDLH